MLVLAYTLRMKKGIRVVLVLEDRRQNSINRRRRKERKKKNGIRVIQGAANGKRLEAEGVLIKHVRRAERIGANRIEQTLSSKQWQQTINLKGRSYF